MRHRYCPYCGHKYHNGEETYCGGCGRPVDQSPSVSGLLRERFSQFFTLDWWAKHDIWFMVMVLCLVFCLTFSIVCVSQYRDDNLFVVNETITGKYIDPSDGMHIIVTDNGAYHTTPRVYYLYDVNDTFNGSWNELEIKHYGTMLKGEK